MFRKLFVNCEWMTGASVESRDEVGVKWRKRYIQFRVKHKRYESWSLDTEIDMATLFRRWCYLLGFYIEAQGKQNV